MTQASPPMPPRRKLLIWRVLVCLIGAFLLWQVVATNLADYYVEKGAEGDRDAVELALWWQADHPRALALKGRWLIRDGEAAAAEPWLQRAIAANPADARPLADLARLRAEAGEQALADDMMEAAHQLMPVDPGVQRNIGTYWLDRGELVRGIGHIATALSGDASLREEYYPLLMLAANEPALQAALEPLALDPPKWWRGFYQYVARNAESADTLGTLVDLREKSPAHPVSDWERETYLQRLRSDGRVGDAYLQWVNHLEPGALQELGYVFNGSFERPLANAGFGWFSSTPRNSGFHITDGTTYGVVGQRALRVSFSGKRARFQHLYQHLFLGPGDYEVSGMARPDGLQARRGLQWRVHCSAGSSELLGESLLLVGTGDWREFNFRIQVPPDCPGQILRLYSAGYREVDHELDGGIWFDDLRIRRLVTVSADASGDSGADSGSPANNPGNSVADPESPANASDEAGVDAAETVTQVRSEAFSPGISTENKD